MSLTLPLLPKPSSFFFVVSSRYVNRRFCCYRGTHRSALWNFFHRCRCYCYHLSTARSFVLSIRRLNSAASKRVSLTAAKLVTFYLVKASKTTKRPLTSSSFVDVVGSGSLKPSQPVRDHVVSSSSSQPTSLLFNTLLSSGRIPAVHIPFFPTPTYKRTGGSGREKPKRCNISLSFLCFFYLMSSSIFYYSIYYRC